MSGRATAGATRAESRSATRKELLRAAAGLFLRDGFVATSLADIAAAAGVTKGAVYSNFQSKEELFLALLAEPASTAEMYAPRQLDDIAGSGVEGVEAAQHFGRHAERVRPSRDHVALFLEANAVALRSARARQLVAGNTRAFAIELGTGLRDLFGAPDADPLTLGLIAQSLYAGLLMHGAFLDEVDTTLFETAYELLAAAVVTAPAR
jgi:AcrR family transcriptional regulator